MSGGLWLSLLHLEFYMESGACALSMMSMVSVGALSLFTGDSGYLELFPLVLVCFPRGEPSALAWWLVFYELSWGSE